MSLLNFSVDKWLINADLCHIFNFNYVHSQMWTKWICFWMGFFFITVSLLHTTVVCCFLLQVERGHSLQSYSTYSSHMFTSYCMYNGTNLKIWQELFINVTWIYIKYHTRQAKAVSDNNRLADKTDRNNPPVIFNKPASIQLRFPPSFGQIQAAWIDAAAPETLSLQYRFVLVNLYATNRCQLQLKKSYFTEEKKVDYPLNEYCSCPV